MMASRTWGTQSLVWVILGHRHLSRSAVPRRAPGTHRCSYRPGRCSARRSGMGWTHIHSPLQGEAGKGGQVMCGQSQLTWCLPASMMLRRVKVTDRKKKVLLAIPSIPLPKLHAGMKLTGKEACQGMKCHHLHPIPVSVTHLFGSPPLCTPTGTSMLLSCLPPGNSHRSGTPCSHMVILLQKNIKKKRGRGVSLGAGPAHSTLYTW